MKTDCLRTVLLLLLVSGLGTFTAAFSKKPVPGAVAECKAGVVTDTELRIAVDRYVRQIKRLSPDKVFSDSEMADLEGSTLTDLILRRVFLSMAADEKVQILDSEVRERYNIVCSGLFENDEKAFTKALLEDGWTEAEYLQNLKEIILAEKMRSQLMEGVDVDSSEVSAYYKENLESYRVDEMEMAHILISAPDRDAPERGLKSIRTVFVERKVPAESLEVYIRNELAAREKKISDLRDSALKGKDFADLAKRYSDDASANQGGSLGLVAKGRMVKPFEDAAFLLKKGEISPVVRTEFGFHIIKALSDPKSRIQDLPEVEFSISAKLRSDKEARKLTSLEQKWKVKRYGTINKGQ